MLSIAFFFALRALQLFSGPYLAAPKCQEQKRGRKKEITVWIIHACWVIAFRWQNEVRPENFARTRVNSIYMFICLLSIFFSFLFFKCLSKFLHFMGY